MTRAYKQGRLWCQGSKTRSMVDMVVNMHRALFSTKYQRISAVMKATVSDLLGRSSSVARTSLHER